MKFIETLKLAVSAIWAHKLRSALTLLGMIVGVTAFVVVVSLIAGFNRYVDEKIAGIGAKSFTVQRFNPLEDFKDTDTIAAAQRRNKELTMDDYDYLKARAQLIDKIGARARGTPSEVKRGNEVLEDVFVSGATANCVDIENRDVAEGRFIAEPENEGASRVAYIGADVATKLFPAGNASGLGDHCSRTSLSSDRCRSGERDCVWYSAGHFYHPSVEDLRSELRRTYSPTLALLRRNFNNRRPLQRRG